MPGFSAVLVPILVDFSASRSFGIFSAFFTPFSKGSRFVKNFKYNCLDFRQFWFPFWKIFRQFCKQISDFFWPFEYLCFGGRGGRVYLLKILVKLSKIMIKNLKFQRFWSKIFIDLSKISKILVQTLKDFWSKSILVQIISPILKSAGRPPKIFTTLPPLGGHFPKCSLHCPPSPPTTPWTWKRRSIWRDSGKLFRFFQIYSKFTSSLHYNDSHN